MSREAFYRDIGRALRLVGRPTVLTDSSRLDTGWVASVIERADLWLTPKFVSEFVPDDFADLPKEAREKLIKAVGEFREVTGAVPSNGPATQEQYEAGMKSLQSIAEVVRDTVLAEWQNAVEQLVREAEAWAKRRGWTTKRESKPLSESVLGNYELPQLLIGADSHTYLFHPIGRFVPGSTGIVDLALLPAFDSIMVSREENGWHIHSDEGRSVTLKPWSEEDFVSAIELLRRRA